MTKKKNNKRKTKIILLLLLLIILLISYFISINNKETKNNISQNITMIIKENDIDTRKIMTQNTKENIVVSSKYIILGNKDIIRINDDMTIKQLTIYNDIIIVMVYKSDNYILNIYDFDGNIIKEISNIIDNNKYYRLTNINNSKYYFNVSNGYITIMGTRIDTDGYYLINASNKVNLCEDNSIKDDDIISATFSFKYNNNYNFSNIKYKETSKYVKDIKKCN